MNDSVDRGESTELARRRFFIRKGLNLALGGAPAQVIDAGPDVTTVALLGQDYPGLRPSMLVSEGDRVRLGQALFVDRRNPEVLFPSPGAGVVAAIHRGARRALEAVVIELDGNDESVFDSFDHGELSRTPPERIRAVMLESGTWTALRVRPYGKIATATSAPHALFITAIDTRPHSPDPAVVVAARRDAFAHGLAALGRLTTAPIFLCTASATGMPTGDPSRITVAEFRGPHPAGLVGTHMHLLAPVSTMNAAWYVGYQDVIGIGELLTTGRLPVDRVIALAGPAVRRPRLMRTRVGACVNQLVDGELVDIDAQLLSGCPLAGRAAAGHRAFLGRYHNQVTALPAAALAPEPGRSSFLLRFWRRWGATTGAQPAWPPMIPVDTFERVLPFDILPTPLFRALLAGDIDTAAALGCLELEEEDLALCRCVCPSGIDYGGLLRSTLTQIEAQA